MTSSYVHCSHCGQSRDDSGAYTSPANAEKDRIWWAEEHLSGRCLETRAAEEAEQEQKRIDAAVADAARTVTLPEPVVAALVDAAGNWSTELDEYIIPSATESSAEDAASYTASKARFDSAIATAQALIAAGEKSVPLADVSAALNRAADQVQSIDPSDERLNDALNLVVNATLHFIDHPEASLQEAVEANYEPDFAAEIIDSLR